MRNKLPYVILVIAIGLAVQGVQHRANVNIKTNQLEACTRGNILRAALNEDVKVLDAFMLGAQTTRQQSAAEFAAQGNQEQYKINQEAADTYKILRSRLVAIESIVCEKVIR